MNSLSRRSILRTAAGGAAAFSLFSSTRIWAQSPPEEHTIESTLTGSIIEIIDDDWEFSLGFGGQDLGDEYLRELYILNNDSSVMEIEFVQTGLTPEEYLALAQDRFLMSWPELEVVDSGVTGDGPWFAVAMAGLEGARSVYCEYQPGAYEEADLMVTLMSEPSAFQANLPSAQQGILIGDLEPFMMIEPSEVLALEFPVLAVAAATEASGRTSRTSRANRGSEDDSATTRRSNRRQQNQSTTTARDGDFVGEVRAHREEFLETLSEFQTALMVFANENAPDEDLADAFGTIDAIASVWLTYPDRVAGLTVPPEFADLGALYREWADEIGALGEEWAAFIGQTGSVDDFFAQLDVVDEIDRDLEVALDAL